MDLINLGSALDFIKNKNKAKDHSPKVQAPAPAPAPAPAKANATAPAKTPATAPTVAPAKANVTARAKTPVTTLDNPVLKSGANAMLKNTDMSTAMVMNAPITQAHSFLQVAGGAGDMTINDLEADGEVDFGGLLILLI